MTAPRHRRDFVRTLALGAAALPAAVAAADEKKKEKAGERPLTEADARMALVLARCGDKLDDDARKTVRSEVERHVRRGEALRKIALDNGDAPFPVFHPYRAPAGETP